MLSRYKKIMTSHFAFILNKRENHLIKVDKEYTTRKSTNSPVFFQMKY